MQKLVTGMISDRGFTLIEILVVIVIIGITLGFALIAFGDFGSSRKLVLSAEHLVNTLKMAQQQAILASNTLGLKIDDAGYQLLKFNNLEGWIPVSEHPLFRFNHFPDNTVITLNTGSQSSATIPEILINATGDMTPFTLQIGTSKAHHLINITGSHNGNIVLKTMPSS